MRHRILSLSLPVLFTAALAVGCDDEFHSTVGLDYSACTGEIVNNQRVVCDDMAKAVDEHCGFDLQIDPCPCAEAIADCVTDQAWLQLVLDCRGQSDDCASYILCLEGVGEAPSGCDNPAEWDCLTTEPEE